MGGLQWRTQLLVSLQCGNSEDVIVNYGPFFYASMPTYILYNDCYRCAGLIQFAMQEKHVGCGFLAVLCP